MLKPRRLVTGDTIGIIAPASPVYDREKIKRSFENFESLGFNVVMGESCNCKNGYLAGDDSTRSRDINTFFKDPGIKGIFCLRGGYGSPRILDSIDYKIILNNPKIFVGYSDITALHFALYRKCRLVTFHGPMVSSDFYSIDDFTKQNLLNCLFGKIKGSDFKLKPIRSGLTKGKLVGGNLSLICSLLGTGYDIKFDRKIVFIEDIDEEPYRIDRMLNQLRLAGVFRRAAGIIIGQFTNCHARDIKFSLSLEDVFEDYFHNLGIPVYCGLPAGHEKSKATIPLGVSVEISDDKLIFLEECVVK